MKQLELSILVKTFQRPECLKNFLTSVEAYQKIYDIKFFEVVIVDDSDSENQKLNFEIIAQFESIATNLISKEFNSLGLSKGRNIGLAQIKTDYFLICDDDMLLDDKCHIEDMLETIKEKNLDVLSGHYRNISSLNATNYKVSNWVGFIHENDEFDIVTIYSDITPEFMICDIAQNFFIGKTQSVKSVGFPEYLPLNEHNVFFLDLKHAGLKVATTNQLYVRHFHIKNKNYSSYRHREVINPIKKTVIGTLVTDGDMYKFKDYLHVAGKRYVRFKEKKKFLNFLKVKL